MVPLIHWRVGRGAISAWYDTWLEDTPLARFTTFTSSWPHLTTTIRSVRWTPPSVGRWKLNIDGASQGNPGPTRGGGILRDSIRCILFVFSNFYNIQTNTVAEAMAIRDDLLLCEEQNITNIVLESDSRVLVDILRADSCPHWRLKNI
ncbi:unnamed protein product [Spirodela intermedia]|uniref:RNase H type-1 domain-containing protein n=1 Tax=Spirodela intermedia TaxID=51605 RepID=A0A7I8KE85_SPIIN|nr:unnamed protein product [Spirodela intermedia]